MKFRHAKAIMQDGFQAHKLGRAVHETPYFHKEFSDPEAILWRAGWNSAALNEPEPNYQEWFEFVTAIESQNADRIAATSEAIEKARLQQAAKNKMIDEALF